VGGAPGSLDESPPNGGLSAGKERQSGPARLLETLDRANLPLLASALTFDAILAFIPLAILTVAGLGFLLTKTAYLGATDPGLLVERFLPSHLHSRVGPDPFALVELLLEKIRNYRSQLTLLAVPLFLWFSTRLFGAVRVCLSRIFQVRQPPAHPHLVVSYILGYLLAKLRDLAMVGVALILALLNTVITAGLAILTARGEALSPPWTFLATAIGRWLGEGFAIGFGLLLFIALYRYASPKRLSWSGALLAGGVATVGFEVAKRLYGLYLAHLARGGAYSVDANVGAGLLLILWFWYMSLVFLIGAAAADVWEHVRQRER
jgi:membrane protein